MVHDDRIDPIFSKDDESYPVHEWLSRLPSTPMEFVPVGSISLGYSRRVRTGINADHVRLLTEANANLPAIIVHRPTMRVIDGAHRLQAALTLKRDTIAVRYFDGSDEDAFVLSVQANVSHGLPLSLVERKAAARHLVVSHPHWSDRLIASITGLSHKTVGAQRQRSSGEITQLNSRLGRDGRARRLEVSEGRRIAAELIKRKPGASLREISSKAGISLGTAKDVRDRVSRAEHEIPRYAQTDDELASIDKTGVEVSRTRPEQESVGLHVPGRADQASASTSVRIQEFILRNLRNDPTLRLNDKGKMLLRHLAGSIINIRGSEQLTVAAPAHCLGSLAKLARANARSWLALAERLETRMMIHDRQCRNLSVGIKY